MHHVVFEPFIELSDWLKGYCPKNGIQLIDPFQTMSDDKGLLLHDYDSGDGVHLNGEGYKALGQFVASEVEEILVPGNIIACLGDSLTEGYPGYFVGEEAGARWMPYPHYLERKDVTVLNFGKSGDTTENIFRRFNSQVRAHYPRPGYCIVHGGANDLFCEVPMETVQGNLVDIYRACKRHNIVPLAMTLLPVRI